MLKGNCIIDSKYFTYIEHQSIILTEDILQKRLQTDYKSLKQRYKNYLIVNLYINKICTIVSY